MKPDDMFLKVEFTAYFLVNGLKIEKREFANDDDLNGIYLDGKRITPSLFYSLDKGSVLEELPESINVLMDRASWSEEFVMRTQIWKEDPSAQRIDEILDEAKDSTK